MKNDNYIVLQGWMINELHLKGNELIAYAMIYAFSQDGKSEFRGSISYVSEVLGVTPANAHSILQRLADKGYITKRIEVTDKGRYCRYAIVRGIIETIKGGFTETIKPPITETIKGGITETVNNNIDIDKKEIDIVVDNSACAGFSKNNISIDKMLESASWCEAICMKHHITLDELNSKAKEFDLSMQCRENQLHSNVSELRRHFDSWLAININSNKSGQGKQVTHKTQKEKESEAILALLNFKKEHNIK